MNLCLCSGAALDFEIHLMKYREWIIKSKAGPSRANEDILYEMYGINVSQSCVYEDCVITLCV